MMNFDLSVPHVLFLIFWCSMHDSELAEKMSKKGKNSSRSAKLKRPITDTQAEEDEKFACFSEETSHVDEDSDLSDSEESVFSGLEDSGSDSDEESFPELKLELDSGEGSSREDEPDGSSGGEGEKVKKDLKKSKKKLQPKSQTLSLKKVANEEKEGENGNLEPHSKTAQQPISVPKDEYEQDTSDEEDIRNTVGNIPMEWYKDYPHIGYDLNGKKIFKPIRNKDELDEFLDKMESPDYWRTVHDKVIGSDIKLTDEQVQLVHRLQKGQFGDVNFNQYEPAVDFFTHETMIHPVTNRPEDKRSFIPSLIEKEKVSKLVHAIKMGWIKPRRPKETAPQYYDLWAKEDSSAILGRHKMHVPAPKMKLPGHEESYNPPPEYLFSEEEKLAWEQQEPEERKLKFIPQKFSSLRTVPGFSRFIQDRFERCLDLYLCPRQRKMRVNVDPEDLIPKLPKPKDLQPFPTTLSLVYRGHTNLVRCISMSPSGQWLASGCDDCTVKLWEVSTARCLKTIKVEGAVKSIAWNPNPAFSLLAFSVEQSVILLNPFLGDKIVSNATDLLISSYVEPEEEKSQSVKWVSSEGEEFNQGFRITIRHPKHVKQVTWHGKGDYFASVLLDNGNMQVLIHQLSKRRSQCPFNKAKGLVQCVSFHPLRPFFFVATQRYVRVYNLIKQELTKKLVASCKWISSMDIHPGGDNIICGSYDSKLTWFDLDLSTKPYKVLRHHKKALRGVAFHKHYPLFASSSDDGSIIVCHGMVYNDLLQNPLIVPVKVLKGHEITRDLGVLDVLFHPTQPWVFSSGADSTIRLYT
ncbi:ribosome biogenesis protein bop1 [Erpetoichthys calabaricus]|uniref:ribosome biogenesis protein bop1 n=1 Tax=Erpetoichthys calabaricus TaxID=27687 RepID=UPI0022346C20|nr:ribosome biogenesis protein bop1 [Erpetoichthys calabaricus]